MSVQSFTTGEVSTDIPCRSVLQQPTIPWFNYKGNTASGHRAQHGSGAGEWRGGRGGLWWGEFVQGGWIMRCLVGWGRAERGDGSGTAALQRLDL